jgi:hypothetical protein
MITNKNKIIIKALDEQITIKEQEIRYLKEEINRLILTD